PPMPSQHPSLRGTRTVLIFHVAMARIDATSDGPSKNPVPCTHWYSVPDRLTPRSETVSPSAFSMWLPATCRPDIAGPTGTMGPLSPPDIGTLPFGSAPHAPAPAATAAASHATPAAAAVVRPIGERPVGTRSSETRIWKATETGPEAL